MSLEMLFVDSANAAKAQTQTGSPKSRAVGADGAFEALMAMAMSAFFGSTAATGTSQVEGTEIAEATQAVQATQVGQTLQVSQAMAMKAAQLPATDATQVGQAEESLEAQGAAGPVEVPTNGAETGGNVAPQMLWVPVQIGPSAQRVVAVSAELLGSSFGSAAGGEFAKALAGAGVEPMVQSFVVSSKQTTEVAVAPLYAGQVQPQVVEEPSAVQPEPNVAQPMPTSPADSLRVAVEVPDSSPEVVTKESVPAAKPDVAVQEPVTAVPFNAQAAEQQRQGAAHRDPSGSRQGDDDSQPIARGPKQSKGDFIQSAVPAERPSQEVEISAARPAVEAASVQAAPVPNDAPAKLSLRDARAVAQTLFQESLKRLPRSVELRLDPPQLGDVTVLLSQRGQDVTVKFVAGSGEAQRMLQSATDDLGRALSEKGLSLSGFSVDTGFRGDSSQEGRGGDGKQPAGSRYHRASRLGAVGAPAQYNRPVGLFNWLA